MLLWCDLRRVKQLVSDTDASVEPPELYVNETLLAVLQAASGDVESACLAGGRYTADDLANLTTAADRALGLTSNTERALQKLVAHLALGDLYERRGIIAEGKDFKSVERALGMLEALRRGDRIFALAEVAEAGVTEAEYFDETDFDRRGDVTDQAKRFFGRRAKHSRPLV